MHSKARFRVTPAWVLWAGVGLLAVLMGRGGLAPEGSPPELAPSLMLALTLVCSGGRARSRGVGGPPIWRTVSSVLLCLCAALSVLFILELVSDLPREAERLLRRSPGAQILGGASLVALISIGALHRSFRQALVNVTLALFVTCVALLAAEIVFRELILIPKVPRTPRQFREVIARWWPKPVAVEKQPGTFRILGLADSFGQVGGPQNYHYLLVDSLNAGSLRYEMVNLSVGEFEPADELAILRAYGPRYGADLVLHGFCVGNDFNSASEPLLTYRNISVRARTGPERFLPRNFTLREWVRRYRLVMADRTKKAQEAARKARRDEKRRTVRPGGPGVAQARDAGPPKPKRPPTARTGAGEDSATGRPKRRPPPQQPSEGTFSRESFLRIVRSRMEASRVDLPRHSFFRIVATLDSLHHTARRMGATYVMVIHPEQYQVEPDLFRAVCERYRLDPSRYDLGRPQRFLINYCRLRNIPYVDLLPAFRTHGAGGGLYLPRDTHYSTRGNEVAAGEIARFLRQIASAP